MYRVFNGIMFFEQQGVWKPYSLYTNKKNFSLWNALYDRRAKYSKKKSLNYFVSFTSSTLTSEYPSGPSKITYYNEYKPCFSIQRVYTIHIIVAMSNKCIS